MHLYKDFYGYNTNVVMGDTYDTTVKVTTDGANNAVNAELNALSLELTLEN
jgi:hypothetical protein